MSDKDTAELNQEPAEDEDQKLDGEEHAGANGADAAAEADGEQGEEPGQEQAAEADPDDATRYKRMARSKEKQLRRTSRELRETQQRLAALEKARSEPTKADPAPKPDDFDDREDYLVAKAKHEFRQEQAASDKSKKETSVQDEASRALATFEQRCDDWDGKPDDFDEVARADDLKVTANMAQAIMEADGDLGPQILYHLGENADEAERISKLSAIGQARAIGRIEAQLSAPKPAKRQSKAPPPVKPIGGSGDTVAKDLGKLNPAEYRKARGMPPIHG